MAALRSLNTSRYDGLVQLVQRGCSVEPILGGQVPQKVFEDPAQLFLHFSRSPLVKPPRSKLNPGAQTFVPSNLFQKSLSAISGTKSTVPNPAVEQRNRTVTTQSVTTHKEDQTQPLPQADDESKSIQPKSDPLVEKDSGDLTGNVIDEDTTLANLLPDRPFTETMNESQLKHEFSEKEDSAVRKIQAVYRGYQMRKVRVEPRPIDRWFKEFSDTGERLKLSRRYLALLRGPFAHFIVCLDSFKNDLHNQKSKMNRTLLGDHRSIEDGLTKLTAIKWVKIQSQSCMSNRFTQCFDQVGSQHLEILRSSFRVSLRTGHTWKSHQNKRKCAPRDYFIHGDPNVTVLEGSRGYQYPLLQSVSGNCTRPYKEISDTSCQARSQHV
jgi:hypothetical protein